MNILLFASGSFSVKILRYMLSRKDNPVALILDKGDRDNCNKKLIKLSNIQEMDIIYSDELTKPKAMKTLRSLDIDVGFLLWWPHIIGKDLIDIAKAGIINLHPSYLPYNRGRDPNFWAILNETPFGATLHYVDSSIDSGDIIAQTEIPVTWLDTGKTLYAKVLRTLLRLFKENYPKIVSGTSCHERQKLKSGSFHNHEDLEAASCIDLDAKYKARDLLNKIRARTFSPHPAAWFVDDGEKYEVRIAITKEN